MIMRETSRVQVSLVVTTSWANRVRACGSIRAAVNRNEVERITEKVPSPHSKGNLDRIDQIFLKAAPPDTDKNNREWFPIP